MRGSLPFFFFFFLKIFRFFSVFPFFIILIFFNFSFFSVFPFFHLSIIFICHFAIFSFFCIFFSFFFSLPHGVSQAPTPLSKTSLFLTKIIILRHDSG